MSLRNPQHLFRTLRGDDRDYVGEVDENEIIKNIKMQAWQKRGSQSPQRAKINNFKNQKTIEMKASLNNTQSIRIQSIIDQKRRDNS